MQGYFLQVWPQTWESIWQPVQSLDGKISPRLAELLYDDSGTDESMLDNEVWCSILLKLPMH